MKISNAVVADESILHKYNCVVTNVENIKIFIHSSGWKFQSLKTNIINKKETDELISRLNATLQSKFVSLGGGDRDEDNIRINNYKLHIPPMIFDNDIHSINYRTLNINITAGDAIQCWASQVSI